MAIKWINDNIFTNIANAIRNKLGTVINYKPSQMADAIRSIPTGGGSGSGTITVEPDNRRLIIPTIHLHMDASNGIWDCESSNIRVHLGRPDVANEYLKVTVKLSRVPASGERIRYTLGYLSASWSGYYLESSRYHNTTLHPNNQSNYYNLVVDEYICYWPCAAGTSVSSGGQNAIFYAYFECAGSAGGPLDFDITIESSPDIDNEIASGTAVNTAYSTRKFNKRIAY